LAFLFLEVALLGSGPFPDLATYYSPSHRPNRPTDLACLFRRALHTHLVSWRASAEWPYSMPMVAPSLPVDP
jgi:hypothetical protein